MKINALLSSSSSISLLLFVLICHFSSAKTHSTAVNNAAAAEQEEHAINGGILEAQADAKRSHFPDGFLFGVSTSAYQIEGAILEDGKSHSDWDAFLHKRGQLNNKLPNGDVANDHYHRFMEDIDLIHSLGVDSYRFSISWTRILPRGKFGGVNAAGIKFYNTIIDNLLLKGIKPFVTIHHGDLPLELQNKYGGWLSPHIQDDFVHYAETCFKHFGDRVKHWITINEPNLVSKMAFEMGIFPPAHCSQPYGNCTTGNSYIEPLIAMHNMLLSHAKASKLYHHEFQPEQGGLIGIVANIFMFEPLTDTQADQEAANLALAFNAAWTFDPVVFGEYPAEMRHFRGKALPEFTPEQKVMLKESADFIGINHYGTLSAGACTNISECDCSEPSCIWRDNTLSNRIIITAERDGVFIGEPTAMDGCYVVPRGINELVDYLKSRYDNKPMFITENGYAEPNPEDGSDDLQHDDVKRVEYHKDYISSLERSIRNGADVRGYFIWTLMDDYEWATGYGLRFGLYAVDRKTLRRSPRKSANWYRDFLKENVITLELNSTNDSYHE